MNEPKKFSTYQSLVNAVAWSMPDEYPSGMAEVFVDEMLEKGEAVLAISDNNPLSVAG
jgi:hypothetical protein